MARTLLDEQLKQRPDYIEHQMTKTKLLCSQSNLPQDDRRYLLAIVKVYGSLIKKCLAPVWALIILLRL